ncbi:MAG: hypothetical protein A2016_11680 [Elusimicrobia bacterium GWF2_62_30]|nr:MAG: hypothetical protein A2016_11680 [Elusimicrobia bacterium GWF2_62_30]
MIVNPEEILKKRWGYDSFKPLQKEAIEAALAGRDCLVVLPTGGGKSLCYQLPAASGKGLVLVVSPLIALMDDQVAAAREAGLAADSLHSNLRAAPKREAYANLNSGVTELLYVSPERLLVGDLYEVIGPRLILAAVDEAHCVSHWGHEFRPEYRRLTEALDNFPKAARMALTATATPVVQDDIRAQLGLRSPEILIGHPDRPNLIYRAFPRRDQFKQVLEVVRAHPGEGGIVYAQTRKDVERLAEKLKGEGVQTAPYHAGLNAEERRKAQDDFVNERLDVIVATIAFGMGIDRSNVRYVVHANTPRSVEHYQQESGRAGRDGLSADCTLLFSAADLMMHRWLAKKDLTLTPERERALEKQLRDIGRYAVSPVCRHGLLAEHFSAPYPVGEKAEDGCGACDVCLGETKGLPDDEALLTAKKVLSAAWRAEGRYGTGYVVNLLLGRPNDRMTGNGHDQLKVFGLLKEAGEPAVRSWIDQLIVQGFLEVTEENEYPLLRITAEGRALCQDKGTVRLGLPVPPKAGKKKSKVLKKAEKAGVVFLESDTELFEKLRTLRRALADKAGIPPYVICQDAALLEMAALKPMTLDALLKIKGMGEKRVEKYGRLLLDAIAGLPLPE